MAKRNTVKDLLRRANAGDPKAIQALEPAPSCVPGRITVWQSYVGRGAPTNMAGRRTGYGRTKSEAHEDARHWDNQAPWARAQRVTIYDHDSASEALAWDVCGLELDDEHRKTTHPLVLLLRRGLYAEAVRRALQDKAVRPPHTALPANEIRCPRCARLILRFTVMPHDTSRHLTCRGCRVRWAVVVRLMQAGMGVMLHYIELRKIA